MESQKNVNELTPDILARIFQYLDWKSRMRCEKVSRNFKAVCDQMIGSKRYPYVDLPNEMMLFATASKSAHFKSGLAGNVFRVHLKKNLLKPAAFANVAQSILSRFSNQIVNVEIHGVPLNRDALETILKYLATLDRICLRGCSLTHLPAAVLERGKAELIAKWFGNRTCMCTTMERIKIHLSDGRLIFGRPG